MENEINKEQYKILKYVNDQNKNNIEVFADDDDKSNYYNLNIVNLDFLFKLDLVEGERNKQNKVIINITPKGKIYLENYRNNKINFWIPVSISVIALIVSIFVGIFK